MCVYICIHHSRIIDFVQSVASQVVLVVKNPPANAGDMRDVGLIPESGRSPGGGHGNPTPVFLPGESYGQGAWQAAIHGVAKSRTGLKRLHTHTVMA